MNKQNSRLVPELRFPEFLSNSGWETVYGNKAFEQISNKDHNSDLPILAITQEFGAIPREMIDYNVSVTQKSVQSYKVVDVGDFIISLRSFQGGIEYSEYKGLCSPAYVILRNKKGIDKRFFKQYFKAKSFIRDLTKNLEGLRDGKMISYKQFSEVLLPKPSPEEQQKIADCLASIDELIMLHTKKLNSLKDYKKGLMQQLLPAEGETVPKLRFPEFKDKGDWVVTTLGGIGSISSGGTPSRTAPEYWDGNIPWASTTLIDFNEIKETNEFITQEGLENSSAKIFPPGTILMAMYGQGKTRGKVAKLGIESAINQACAAITIDKEMSTEFVLQNLASRYDEIRKISNPGGQENLSAGLIKNIPFKHPKIDSGEQEKIAAFLTSLDEVIFSLTEKIESLIIHKKGLFHKLFPVMDEVN